MTKLPTRTIPTRLDSKKPEPVIFEKVLDSVFGHRALFYGPGGIGKSTLACQAPGPVAFFDVDESLEKLKPQLESQGIPLPLKVRVEGWRDMRTKLQSPGWDSIKTLVFDTWAAIEPMLIAHTLKTVRNDTGHFVPIEEGIEGYGYGKGYKHVFETYLPFLGDLDRHVRAGRNVIIISHDDASKVPNPAGQDYIRWEPKMQHTPNASIRYRTKDWSDHTLFLSYDIDVSNSTGDKKGNKAGRVAGHGSRTLYCAELPYFMAKSRTTQKDFQIELGASPWGEILT